MNRPPTLLLAAALAVSLGTQSFGDESAISIEKQAGKFVVTVGGSPFCEVDYQSYAKPIVYPVFGPNQVPMTRNHPMKSGVAGEADDHPHHKSMWFGHGDVNGISFWHEEGKIVTEQAEIVPPGGRSPLPDGQPTIRLQNRLVGPDGNLVCRETMLLGFGATDQMRWIDWHVTAHAGNAGLKFGDTKEGTAALRVHPNLRPDNRATRGTDIRPAKAINSDGLEGNDVWGKRAKWVDYSGSIDGHLVGIAFFDNPKNLRHPTYWHARGYGLFAANPFGLSNFVGDGQDGSYSIDAGERLDFRYRIVFHPGDAATANVEQLYQTYASEAE